MQIGLHLRQLFMGLASLAEATASSPNAMACIVTCVNAEGMKVGNEQPDIIQHTIVHTQLNATTKMFIQNYYYYLLLHGP